MTHTPGPWELHQQIDDANSLRVCIRDGTAERGCRPVAEAEILGMPRDEAEANARLIAAAPDLLAAVKALRDGAYGNPGYPADNDRIDAQADAAIAKAEGAA